MKNSDEFGVRIWFFWIQKQHENLTYGCKKNDLHWSVNKPMCWVYTSKIQEQVRCQFGDQSTYKCLCFVLFVPGYSFNRQ